MALALKTTVMSVTQAHCSYLYVEKWRNMVYDRIVCDSVERKKRRVEMNALGGAVWVSIEEQQCN